MMDLQKRSSSLGKRSSKREGEPPKYWVEPTHKNISACTCKNHSFPRLVFESVLPAEFY